MTESDAVIAHVGSVDDSYTLSPDPEVHVNISDPETSRSVSLRMSLKRGLARQAFDHARTGEADLPHLLALAADLRPNRKATERLAHRARKCTGVVRASIAADGAGLVLVARSLRVVVTQVEGTALFGETSLVYTRLFAGFDRAKLVFHLSRASFCQHALERLVERSRLALDQPMLPTVDTEAIALLRGLSKGTLIVEDDDQFMPAIEPGVWAGGVDMMVVEPDWNLRVDPTMCMPVFSVRTFLGPNEMRRSLWQRVRNDPSLTVV